MKKLLAILTTAGLLSATVGAQTQSTSTTTTSLASKSPQENAAVGAVSQRAPGTWVRAALARHMALNSQRRTDGHFGDQSSTQSSAQAGSGTSGSSSTGLGSLGSLLSLAGGSGGLGNLISGLAGGTSGSSGTNGSSTSGQNYTLADLIAMGQAAGSSSGSSSSSSTKTGTAQVRQDTSAGGAIGRLPKLYARSQSSTGDSTSTTTPEQSFGKRWSNAMLETFFTALSAGFQTPAFITVLKDALRPLILPPAAADGSSTGGSGSSGGSGGSSSTGSGGGIENLPASGGSSGSSL